MILNPLQNRRISQILVCATLFIYKTPITKCNYYEIDIWTFMCCKTCLLVSLNHTDYATLPDVRCEGQYSNIPRHTR